QAQSGPARLLPPPLQPHIAAWFSPHTRSWSSAELESQFVALSLFNSQAGHFSMVTESLKIPAKAPTVFDTAGIPSLTSRLGPHRLRPSPPGTPRADKRASYPGDEWLRQKLR